MINRKKDSVGANIRTLPKIENPVLTHEYLTWHDVNKIMSLIKIENPGLHKLISDLTESKHGSEKVDALNSHLVLISEIARSLNGNAQTKRKLRAV